MVKKNLLKIKEKLLMEHANPGPSGTQDTARVLNPNSENDSEDSDGDDVTLEEIRKILFPSRYRTVSTTSILPRTRGEFTRHLATAPDLNFSEENINSEVPFWLFGDNDTMLHELENWDAEEESEHDIFSFIDDIIDEAMESIYEHYISVTFNINKDERDS